MTSITSEEVNYLILRYLQEAGFVHSAFAFGQESFISKAEIRAQSVPPGMLVTLLQRGLYYTSIEFHLNDDGSERECHRAYSLLEPHICEKHPSSYIPRPNTPGTTEVKVPGGATSTGVSGMMIVSGSTDNTTIPMVTAPHKEKDEKVSNSNNIIKRRKKENDAGGDDSGKTSKKNSTSKRESSSKGGFSPTNKNNNAKAPSILPPPSSTSKIFGGEKMAKGGIIVETFEKIRILTGHESEVITCAWNPSKSINLLASASGDGTVRLWKVPITEGVWDVEKTKTDVIILEHSSLTTPPNHYNTEQSTAGNNLSGESRDVTTMDWSPNGKFLATGCYDGKARLWSANGELISTLSQHKGPIFQLKWSPDGNCLASVGVDPAVAVWDVPSRSLRHAFNHHDAPALDVDWRDSKTFATCSTDRRVLIYSLDSKEERPVLTLIGHTDEVNSIKWSPNGEMLLSSSDDMTARIWRVESDLSNVTLVNTLAEHTMEIYTAKWNCLSEKLTPPSEHEIDGPSNLFGQTLATESTSNNNHHHQKDTISQERDRNRNETKGRGELLIATASFDGTIKLWDAFNGACLHTLRHHTQPVYAISFSPCGRFLASGSLDAALCLWSVNNGKLQRSYYGNGGIFELSWSPTGNKIAAGTADATLCVIDVPSSESFLGRKNESS